MKFLLLGTALLAPLAALAQQPATFPEMLNPRGFRLAQRAVLYRRLGDTLNGHPARRLRPGNEVILFRSADQQHARWLKVVRGDGTGTSFSKDTATYHLPAQALKGAQMFVLI